MGPNFSPSFRNQFGHCAIVIFMAVSHYYPLNVLGTKSGTLEPIIKFVEGTKLPGVNQG